MPDEDDIANRFKFHPADTDDKKALHGSIRLRCGDLARVLNKQVPECREKSLAMTKLEEVMFWANAAVARKS